MLTSLSPNHPVISHSCHLEDRRALGKSRAPQLPVLTISFFSSGFSMQTDSQHVIGEEMKYISISHVP